MALHKGLLKAGFKLPVCEKHFHDHDETWVILNGKGTGYWIDHGGNREEFELDAGDVWLIPTGFEHGSEGFKGTGKNSEDFTICVFYGTQPEGCHKPGHYYVEKEGYLPSFELKKSPTDRYTKPLNLPATMRGIIFSGKGKTAFQDEPTPGCSQGTVLCQSVYTGLTNGTERNLLMGGNYGGTWPSRCGYQNVGRVLAVGVGVQGFKVGDTIFSAEFCQHRQYFAAPATADKLIVKIPEAVDPRHAALFGAASVAMHDVRRADVKLGEKVLVVGAGPIGQFTAQAARLAGAVVTICDLNEKRLGIAGKLGAHATIALTTDAASWEAVKQAGPFDVVFEDSGAPILDSVIGANWGLGVLKHRSRVVIIAGRGRVDYSFNAGQGYELSVFHAGHFVCDDLQQVCRLTAEGLLRIGPVIQDVVKADKAIAIYDTLRDNPGNLFGVVFDWD
jgi:2-desacetyl-2-hydroxyethyl bacteriochlorophyllide A dehydrogenase